MAEEARLGDVGDEGSLSKRGGEDRGNNDSGRNKVTMVKKQKMIPPKRM